MSSSAAGLLLEPCTPKPVKQPALSEALDLRRLAHLSVEESAARGHHADCASVVRVLNQVLATELACIRRSRRPYPLAVGLASSAIAFELSEHAADVEEQVDNIAQRVAQLGGTPVHDAIDWRTRGLVEAAPGATLLDMIEEDLVAHWVGVESCGEIASFLGDEDPTTRRLVEDISSREEEHALELADILARLGRVAHPLIASADGPTLDPRRRCSHDCRCGLALSGLQLLVAAG